MSQNRQKCLHRKGGVYDTGIPPHLGWWWPAKSEGDMNKNMSFLIGWKSIEGHARGVERMLEHDASCVDSLKQTLAIQGAIGKVNEGLLERHMQTRVTTAIRSDDAAERERVLAELMSAFNGSGRLRRIAARSDVIGEIAGALAAGSYDDTRECERPDSRCGA